MRVAIIGAGPAGLTAGYKLQQSGIDVEIFEASPHLGGLARSIDLWGHKVDLGPHRFFSQNAQVNAFWHEMAEHKYRSVNRRTRIYYRKRFFEYPLEISDILTKMDLGDLIASLLSWLKARSRRQPQASDGVSFETWIVSRFGQHLFNMFFKSYTEKLWGIPCSELDADFAAQRIKGFSLGGAIAAALSLGKGRHRTLVDRFDYPTQGCGAVYETMARRIVANGGKIHLNRGVKRVVAVDRTVTGLELADGATLEGFAHVVSTMPLTLMAEKLPSVPDRVLQAIRKLRYRNTILVYLKVESASLFSDQWVYVHEPDVSVGRVTNFRNWVPELYGDLNSTVLALEFWCDATDAIWRSADQDLIDLGASELRQIGLIADAPVMAGHVVRVARSYPVYSAGYRDHLRPLVEFLRSFKNLWPIGRYGAFKYNNQDHSIFMGLLAAENIAEGSSHDLWGVNSDYDKYQEAAPDAD
jgi:protoporphyrinogen oxidase